MRRASMTGFAGAVALLLSATSVLATQVVLQTPQQLAQESALIVNGTVTGVRSYWNDDHSKILTEATVAVEGTYKGEAASTVRVVQLGGVVGNVRMTAHGALQWKRGEDVLLFLEPSVPGAFQVAGFSQGKYMIERDAQTGKAYVHAAVTPDTGETSAPAPSNGRAAAQKTRVSLDQFLNQVLPKQ
jgi:hypothetical protein